MTDTKTEPTLIPEVDAGEHRIRDSFGLSLDYDKHAQEYAKARAQFERFDALARLVRLDWRPPKLTSDGSSSGGDCGRLETAGCYRDLARLRMKRALYSCLALGIDPRPRRPAPANT